MKFLAGFALECECGCEDKILVLRQFDESSTEEADARVEAWLKSLGDDAGKHLWPDAQYPTVATWTVMPQSQVLAFS